MASLKLNIYGYLKDLSSASTALNAIPGVVISIS
jgi:hypothetical protein